MTDTLRVVCAELHHRRAAHQRWGGSSELLQQMCWEQTRTGSAADKAAGALSGPADPPVSIPPYSSSRRSRGAGVSWEVVASGSLWVSAIAITPQGPSERASLLCFFPINILE